MTQFGTGPEFAKQCESRLHRARPARMGADQMIAYLAILLTALAAFAGAPVYAVLPGAAILFTIAFREHRHLAARFAAINAAHVLTAAAWQSAGHALIASGAAWGVGLLSRLAFQM